MAALKTRPLPEADAVLRWARSKSSRMVESRAIRAMPKARRLIAVHAAVLKEWMMFATPLKCEGTLYLSARKGEFSIFRLDHYFEAIHGQP